ncbi:MAG: TetR/AcrR family transcriptional regulator [Proteobacteria bacterium]|nr:TetR/AcrR family transcriptional regulator [Pseudomonadota bacterium]
MPRPKQRTPELKQRVLDAALALLATRDVAGLTTREVARRARTSPPAIYELFGDKQGLVREIFYEGFRRLHRHFEGLRTGDDPESDLIALIRSFRRFAAEHPTLVEVMFARPFADFRPDAEDLRAAVAVQQGIVERVQRCIDAGLFAGDPADIAHVLMALSQGLAAAENAGRLGSSRTSVNRRWKLAIETGLRGFSSEA